MVTPAAATPMLRLPGCLLRASLVLRRAAGAAKEARMLEVIDLLLAPLFRISPVRYLRDPAYRQRIHREQGKAGRYRMIFLMLLVLAAIALLALVILARYGR
jgi:hypothetical protein